ncbi:MAG: molybdopterin-dependent oxidoreductase [Nitrososphaerota archaeon]|jgi:anaerobic selenocysteine-containing dehydrogenase|nr:molybdopterin-dependent oxidoreductase [Nitrososphaerota archaeon]MDG6930280.1 molybdopterin-dependent oxidoreductase [Nitrososphaerota archaeon]MDG6932975.1 molybdopterin-dependent oxidoreductase [Nitrososphaerota archaeon]MDG6935707.1 molybdopterin-dependent oxidoreductase [Nitrososphaerota archaeon]MDG6943555.1 molybdopterin-dependent oxidoreductase [Nitrososphaerota archaeon]
MEKAQSGYTFCDACTTPFCGIKASVKDGKIARIESWENYPNGPLCAKGYLTLQTQYSPLRLGYPVIRTNPKGSPDPGWKRISWEEAYDTIASRLNEVKMKHGPESVLFYVGDPKEPRLAVSRLASMLSPVFRFIGQVTVIGIHGVNSGMHLISQ